MSDHCCQMMTNNLAGGETAINYAAKFREYGIPVLDGGSPPMVIAYCPWCGSQLPPGLRDRWFDLLEEQGLEPNDSKIPDAFRSEEWWKA